MGHVLMVFPNFSSTPHLKSQLQSSTPNLFQQFSFQHRSFNCWYFIPHWCVGSYILPTADQYLQQRGIIAQGAGNVGLQKLLIFSPQCTLSTSHPLPGALVTYCLFTLDIWRERGKSLIFIFILKIQSWLYFTHISHILPTSH